MNIKKNFISHQKSRSISNNLPLKDVNFENELIKFQSKNSKDIRANNCKDNNNPILKDKNIENNKKIEDNDEEKINELDFGKTIEEMNQNILDLYYDKNSSFKKKIDDLNLKFYLETEKYLNNSKINDHIRNQQLQANLFIILFKQINIFIEEIERLNKLILENKYKKEKILQRTNELNEKKQNILIKDNLIQYLKKSNTNIEKKLLETLLHEDKLIKDNERLRKENETYKSLTIVFENELKNTVKKSGLTPQKNKIARHMKTYSDYGVPTTSIINELCGQNNIPSEEKFGTINNESKFSEKDRKKNMTINVKKGNKESSNKNYNSINVDKKIKNNDINKYKIPKNQILTENNTIKDKKSLKQFSPNNRIKAKQSQDGKMKIKYNKIDSKNMGNKNKTNNHNLCYNFEYNKNMMKCYKNKNLNSKKSKNVINIDSISNNINSTINTNTNTMTETNNLSFEKSKDKNYKKLEMKKVCYHKKQKTMSEISFKEIVRVQILNDELSNTVNPGTSNAIKIKKNEGKINMKKSPFYKNSNKNNIKKNL